MDGTCGAWGAGRIWPHGHSSDAGPSLGDSSPSADVPAPAGRILRDGLVFEKQGGFSVDSGRFCMIL